MPKLEIKLIKGFKYLYIKYKVKVNNKNLPVSLYVGRFEKVTLQDFISKLGTLQETRLTKFTDFWLRKKNDYLSGTEASNIERIHYSCQFLKKSSPDELALYEKSVFSRYVQGTTAIEGNTISQRQVDELFEHGVTPSGKSMREVYEVINFRKLRDFLEDYEGDVSEKFIRKVHAILMDELFGTEFLGEYRRVQVMIEKAEHEPQPAFEVPGLMRDVSKWYLKNRSKMNPFELAVLLHTKFVTIHPFLDGNGRVARALMNFVLEKNGYPTLYFGIEHRDAYLDAVAEGNEENYESLVALLYGIYVSQHGKFFGDVDGKGFVESAEGAGLVEEFKRMKGTEEGVR